MTDVDTFETQSPGVIKPCAAPRKNNFNLYKGVRFYCSEMIVCGMHCNGGGGGPFNNPRCGLPRQSPKLTNQKNPKEPIEPIELEPSSYACKSEIHS